ncbi:MAG: PAS domain-containing protein [Gemmatimonadota bacterium]|nr:PAS domain-containing protein [Gemmatimonadota bacterium]
MSEPLEHILSVSDLPGVVYRCRNDAHWTMLALSENVHELTGYRSTELVHNDERSFASLVHVDDRKRVAREIDEALAEGVPFRVAYRIRTRRGSERWVLAQGRGTETGHGQELTGYIQDISDTPPPEGKGLVPTALGARRHVELLQQVTALVNAHDTLGDALTRAVPLICDAAGFEVARVFYVEESGALTPSPFRYTSASARSDSEPFELVGAEVPGAALELVERARTDRRAVRSGAIAEGEPAAPTGKSRDRGLALAVPVLAGSRVPAVMWLASSSDVIREPELVTLVEQAAVQLGRV